MTPNVSPALAVANTSARFPHCRCVRSAAAEPGPALELSLKQGIGTSGPS
jgi:hypothetical protein